MPHIYPNIHLKHDHDHSNEKPPTRYLTTLSNTVVHSISSNQPFPNNRNDVNDADDLATIPNLINRSSSKSIFVPASTSKYPIKQNTIAEDIRERFMNFLTQWIKAIVYLARK